MSLESELERATLARWAPQTNAADLMGLWDTLAEGYMASERGRLDAQRRGDRAAARRAQSESAALGALLAEVSDEVAYRRKAKWVVPRLRAAHMP